MNCSQSNIPIEILPFLESQNDPDIIRADFKNSESAYGLVIDRDVPFTLAALLDYDELTDTYTLSPGGWSTVTLSIDHDLSISTSPIATFDFQIVDQGVLDPEYVPGQGKKPRIAYSERWTGVFPASELNKLTTGEWAMAVLKGDDNIMISRCLFKVLGA